MKRPKVRWLWIAPTWLIAGVLPAQTSRLGTIDFPTSGPPAAQAQFIRGVLLLHSFEYQDAARAFREAQRIDPEFALAYWGEALTSTHPLWDEQDASAARAVLQRLGPTPNARRAKAPTPRERAYLNAVETLYGDGPKARRDTAYSRAMERLVTRFPADREAQVFYAASLLGLSQGVRNVPTYMRAAAIVARVFRENPDHPGAAHLLIHCYDDPVHARLGLPAARAYSKIAPDAAHAQHMTTHIFLALGMWDEVVSQNELASGRDPATWAPDHYTQWLGYGYLQQGRYGEALRHLERMRENVDKGGRGRAHARGDGAGGRHASRIRAPRGREAGARAVRGDPVAGRPSQGSATRVCACAPACPEARAVAARPRSRGSGRGGRDDGGPGVRRVAGDVASRRCGPSRACRSGAIPGGAAVACYRGRSGSTTSNDLPAGIGPGTGCSRPDGQRTSSEAAWSPAPRPK